MATQVGSQYRKFAEPAGQMQNGKWVPASNKAGLTLRFENSGGKPPGPYCRNLDEAPAEGEVCPLPILLPRAGVCLSTQL